MKSKTLQSDEYEVEKIVDYREIKSVQQYLVKWKGYSDDENTWEPEANLNNCRNLIDEFWNSKPEFCVTILGVRKNQNELEYFANHKRNGLFTISTSNKQKYMPQIVKFWEEKFKEMVLIE